MAKSTKTKSSKTKKVAEKNTKAPKLSLPEKYDKIIEIIDSTAPHELMKMVGEKTITAELWAAPKTGFSKYVWASAELSFDPDESTIYINKGKDNEKIIKLFPFTLLVNENQKDHRISLEHGVRYHVINPENGSITYNGEECYELGIVFKMRQLFEILL